MKNRIIETIREYMKRARGAMWRAGMRAKRFVKNRNFREMAGKYGYYACLAVMLAALGIASASYRNKMENIPAETEAYEPVTVSAVITPAPTLTPEPHKEKPEYMLPLEGGIITAYAPDNLVWNETLGQWQTHPAIDISGEAGESVFACAAGTITDAYRDILWGNVIEIAHDDGMRSVYRNLGTLNIVSVGDRVSCGDIISTVGKSAQAEDSLPWHLHFEFMDEEGESADFFGYTGIDGINGKTEE